MSTSGNGIYNIKYTVIYYIQKDEVQIMLIVLERAQKSKYQHLAGYLG